MKTYSAGAEAGDSGQVQPDNREWVFGLLATPRYRERMEQLQGLDLRRRPGCEPCLRSLVTDEWTPETLHHLGWCDSCRAATIALGMHTPAGEASWLRRRAGWLAVAAFAVIAVPLVASQVVNQGSELGARGGSANQIPAVTIPTTPGTTTPGATTPSTTTPATLVTPVPRSKRVSAVGHQRSAGGKKALPLTT
jgi:hypothetical protein